VQRRNVKWRILGELERSTKKKEHNEENGKEAPLFREVRFLDLREIIANVPWRRVDTRNRQ